MWIVFWKSRADHTETEQVNGVVLATARVDIGSDAKPLMKNRLGDGAREITEEQIGERRNYANPAGHGLLHDIEKLKDDIQHLHAEDMEQKALNDSLSTSVAQLKVLSDTTKVSLSPPSTAGQECSGHALLILPP